MVARILQAGNILWMARGHAYFRWGTAYSRYIIYGYLEKNTWEHLDGDLICARETLLPITYLLIASFFLCLVLVALIEILFACYQLVKGVPVILLARVKLLNERR